MLRSLACFATSSHTEAMYVKRHGAMVSHRRCKCELCRLRRQSSMRRTLFTMIGLPLVSRRIWPLLSRLGFGWRHRAA